MALGLWWASLVRADGPNFAGTSAAVRVPFSRKVDFDDLKSLHVHVSINGGKPISLLVDTGSVGIIVAADEVPDIDPHAPAGSMVYTSSGIELDGVWTEVTVTFVDSKDADGKPASAVVPVLAASERKVTPGAVNGGNAKPTKNPKVFMCGIGFGRGKEPHPERNPFINLDGMTAGKVRRGYTITRDGFGLGLTAADSGYQFQKLIERTVAKETVGLKPGLKDWESSTGRVIVDGVAGPPAAVLIDTGLTNMMIGLPDTKEHADVVEGTPVAVELLDGKFRYDFKVGDGRPRSPRRVTYLKPSIPRPTLNTGLRVLQGYDYLYDADGGYLGLRAVK